MNGEATQHPSLWITIVVALVIGGLVGYWYGGKRGYDRGLTDAARIQSGAETEVRVDTGYKNPYEGVNLNPFR